jgi:microcystin degradation protein MlrC
MPTILIAECVQEVSSFNPVRSTYADFTIRTGDSFLTAHRGGKMEVGGALSIFEARPDIRVVPTYSARSTTSGGLLEAQSFTRLAREFLDAVKAAPPVDAAYIALHGAMAAENEHDPEGYLLAEVRKLLGEAIPIVISLDLHGVPTDKMLTQANALTVYHTYPHIDFFDTGVRAARLLLRIMEGSVRPVTAKVAIPALVRGDQLITQAGRFGQSIRAAQAAERAPQGLAAGVFIGNPFTDVPELQSYSVVTTDDDPQAAAQAALAIARDFWAVRHELQAALVPLDEAIRLAASITNGTVILTDAADATSSGAAGDSNAILRALMAADYRGRALLPIVDAPAVESAFAAGIGAVITTTVGGRRDPCFAPLPIRARVRLLSDGDFINESHGTYWHAGHTAVLEAEDYTLVVTSRPVSLYDRSLFLAHGQNPQHFDLVVSKSPHCQPQFYAAWAARVINVDAPGSTSANLPTLGYRYCPRPIFPLDAEMSFTPAVTLFRRH